MMKREEMNRKMIKKYSIVLVFAFFVIGGLMLTACNSSKEQPNQEQMTMARINVNEIDNVIITNDTFEEPPSESNTEVLPDGADEELVQEGTAEEYTLGEYELPEISLDD